MYTFLKTVTSFESIKLNLESDIFQFEGTISNLNIMKSAFYTKDLYYPKNIPPDSGQFKILLLEQNGPWSLLCRFLKAFLFGQMSSAFNREWQANSLRVNSPNTIPLEIDGEIYWGQKFDFQCQSKKMRVCL
jgi:diacylglycerol kinase family enzyme